MKKNSLHGISSCLAKPPIKGVVLMKIITKNERNSNERTVCSLKEIEKRKIVEHNDLITSVAKMDKTFPVLIRKNCPKIIQFTSQKQNYLPSLK